MIHPTAIIHPGAKLGQEVEVGPYAVIGEHVSLGDGCRVGAHTVIEGWTELGEENRVFQFASVGAPPQDLKYKGEQTHLRLGARNTVREFVTLNRGTVGGGGETIIGNDNLFMAYCHVAHDCRIGNRVVMANAATLAGHVEIEDAVIVGGLVAIHQFTRIGSHVMISGGSMVAQDIPPFTIAQGDRARTVGLNLIGLKRQGFSAEAIAGIKRAYKAVFRSGQRLEEALAGLADDGDRIPEVRRFIDFIRSSERGVAR